MGRSTRTARVWLAELLYGLITGNYRRVAEMHFEAQYVPAHHDVAEFATALRAVGEPMRGKPVSELSVGQMLDRLAILRDELAVMQERRESERLFPDESWQREFTQAGRYPYTCGPHPEMKGVVIVVE